MDRRTFLRSAATAGLVSSLSTSHAWAALTEIEIDVRAVTGDRSEITLERAAVQELADRLRGNLLLPGNPGYDRARRVINSSIDKYPALIVQPIGTTDIREAVSFANDRDLLLAVKCGGHSYAGKSTCQDGMQIDLSTFRHARVDPKAKTANVAGGSLLAELDREAMAFGLVTTAGTVSHTGVGGLTTAGGFGRLGRRFGLACDNVKSVDVVTADGRFLRASPEENEDLYWGVRGGGGNFGIVTNFEFQLHEMQRDVVSGTILFDIGIMRDVVNVYRDMVASAPDELYLDLMVFSPLEGAGGMCGFELCWSGDAGKAEKVLAPIFGLGQPVMNTIATKDYVATQKSWDNTDPRNTAEYLKGGFVNEVPDALIDDIITGFAPQDRRAVMVYLQHSGGAIGRVAAGDTAFAHRKSVANMFMTVGWPLEDAPEPNVDYIRSYWDTLFPYTDGYYTVDTADESDEVRHSNYQGNFKRLLEIKKKYDPTNLFRLNANIRI